MLSKLSRAHTDERGLVLVATLVIVSLLFFIGAAMALAVESNLHSVGQISSEDATHYAAESAVARGVADTTGSNPPRTGSCGSPQPPINGLRISSIECYVAKVRAPSHDSVRQWAVPAPKPTADRVDMDLEGLRGDVSLWTVIGSRGKVKVSVENGNCELQAFPAGANYYANYYQCSLTVERKQPARFQLVGVGGTLRVAPFVIRAAEKGSMGFVVTVIGRVGNETAQADVFIPSGDKPVLGLWSTVIS